MIAASVVGICLAMMSVASAGEVEGEKLMRATGAVATVDGEEIKAEAFNAKMEVVEEGLGAEIPVELAERFRDQALDTLIEGRLMEAALGNADGEDESGQETSEELDEQLRLLSTASGVHEQQAPDGMRSMVEQLQSEKGHRLQARIDAHLRREYGLEVSKEEVREFFEENRRFLASSEKVNLRKIRMGLNVDDREAVRERARQTYEAIAGGEMSFYDAAQTLSDSRLTGAGGEVGYVRRTGIVEQVADVAFELERNQLSEPIETPYAVYIVEVLDRRPERAAEFEELATGIERLLLNNRRQELYRQWVEDLRQEAEIEIHLQNIGAAGDGG